MSMTRDEYKALLLKADIPEEVVTDLLAHTEDKDLVRMKDLLDGDVDNLVDALLAAVTKAEEDGPKSEKPAPPAKEIICPKCGAKNPADATKCTKCGASLSEEKPPKTEVQTAGEVAKSMLVMADIIVNRLKGEAILPTELEVEVPELTEIKDAIMELRSEVAALKDMLLQLTASDENRLKDIVSDMSPASRIRLRQSLSDAQAIQKVAEYLQQRKDAGDETAGSAISTDGAVIKDAAGKTYATLADFAYGKPAQA